MNSGDECCAPGNVLAEHLRRIRHYGDKAGGHVDGNPRLPRQVNRGRDDVQVLAQQPALPQERRHFPGIDVQVSPGELREVLRGSIPVIRSHSSEADQRRFSMVRRANHDARLGRLMAFSG